MSAKILIVEDEQMLLEVYKLVLEAQGYTVSTAMNGVEALEVIKKFKPDLILLDMFMPIMDGKEFLRNFDGDDLPNVKVLVYTNLSDKTTRNEMIELGAHDFVLKSDMTPNDLIDLVKRTLG